MDFTKYYLVLLTVLLPCVPPPHSVRTVQSLNEHKALAQPGPLKLRWAYQGQETGGDRCGSGDGVLKTQL